MASLLDLKMILSFSTHDILLEGVHMQHEDVKCYM